MLLMQALVEGIIVYVIVHTQHVILMCAVATGAGAVYAACASVA